MPRTQRTVKKFEKRFASNVSKGFGISLRSIGHLFVKIFKIFDNRLTIMIVPHSKSRVLNFRTNVFALILSIVLFFGVIVSFFYINSRSISTSMTISALETQNRETLASLDQFRDENANLFQAAKKFQASLSQSLSILGIESVEQKTDSSSSNGDLASLFSTREIASGSSKEIADIQELTNYLEDVIEPIDKMGKMLKTQQSLFNEIPSICPLRGPNLHISMPFGPNIHPLQGNWYIHKGMDMSTYRSGDPVVAAASGQVVTTFFDSGYGLNVIIKHNHGFYTRYAHLSVIEVTKGQMVEQGQLIAYSGNTGISTGPHLHYEVHIGSDVVDPAKYINTRTQFRR
ncbi:MAG: M23 family metallopeptidase [Treponema sp.]|nr:M23 family metallopeptidase [Treponema sp.]